MKIAFTVSSFPKLYLAMRLIIVLFVSVIFFSSCSKHETLNINESVRLDNIYYEYDKRDILSEAEKELNVLRQMMVKYPTLIIELSSHTDARGPSKFNQVLSQNRADAAKLWLVDNGIEGQRIQAVGYGEEQILNNCLPPIQCSDEEHAFNRRTEFKIVEGPAELEIKKRIFNQ